MEQNMRFGLILGRLVDNTFFDFLKIYLFGLKQAKYSQSIVSCSTGETSLHDFYIMTLVKKSFDIVLNKIMVSNPMWLRSTAAAQTLFAK